MSRRQQITRVVSSTIWIGWVLLAWACAPRSSAGPAARAAAAQRTSDTGKQTPDIIDISAAGPYACAVRADHRVWCWGDFHYWPLHVDPQRRRPLALATFPAATHVFTGPAGVCATAREGGLYCLGESWLMGLDENGVSLADTPRATRVMDRSPTSMVFSEYHACALEQGAIWCWGDDVDGTWWLGQEGADGVPEPHRPRHVSGLPLMVRMSASDQLTCGIDAESQLWCWGRELSFEDLASLDTGELIGPRRIVELEHGTEVFIDFMSNIVVAAGSQVRPLDSTETRTYDFGRPVSSVRAIHAAGMNAAYYAIDAARQVVFTDGASVQTLPMLKGVERLVGGGMDPLLCAVTRERRVFCWNGESPPASEEPYPAGVYVLDARQYLGWIPFPPLATASDEATAKRPKLVPRPRRSGSSGTIVRLAVADEDACVLRGDGRAYCWLLGREDAPRLLTPTPLVDIAVRVRVICGVTEEGSVPCWTLEENDTLTPRRPLGLRDAARIDAMAGRLCVLHTHGRITCVGPGAGQREGQATVAGLQPIHGIEDAIQVQTQPFGVCALRARGGVVCWHERFGLLEYDAPTAMRHIVPDATGTWGHQPSEPGEPRTTITALASDGRLWQARLHEPALTPVAEQALRWQRLAYGASHRCGITTEERLVCWGDNVSGRLGRGFVSMVEAEPAPVQGLPPIRHFQLAVAGGCASDGTSAWCWGRAKAKRLRAKQPTRVSIDTPITSFAFASGQGAAVDTNGDLWAWGNIGFDPFELTHDRATPVRVHAGEPLETIRLGRLVHCGITRSKRVVCWHGTGQPVPISLPDEVQSLSLRDNEACATVAGERTFCWQASAARDRTRTVTLSQPIEAPRHATPPATGAGSPVLPSRNEPTPPDAPDGCRRTGAASFRCGNDEIVFPAPITAVAGRARDDRDTWCALAEGGKLYCLGFGRDGRLGDGRGGERPAPIRVALP